jgi:hypothetical protein
MKSFLFVLLVLLAALPAPAQIELVSDSFFPAEFEFPDLQKIASEKQFEDPAQVVKVPDGKLISDVGFRKYDSRIYSLGSSGSMSIEILTLQDTRAAYSLLTLLRDSAIHDGPPGDAFTKTGDGIRFAQGKRWVRIQGRGTPEDLVRRVAVSVSNRMGQHRVKLPSLVSYLPRKGYDAASLRYYPGMKAFESFSGSSTSLPFRINPDMEIVQAHYGLDNYAGTLYLLSFPTPEIAEDYYHGFNGAGAPATPSHRTYLKRAGAVVGVLEGSFDPGTAEKILGTFKTSQSYSVQWVYEKSNRPKMVWGVPVGILSTVVKSLLFVVVLCGVSVLAGFAVAYLRVAIRCKRSPDQAEKNEITRLRLR